MSWKLIFALSLFGLGMAFATVYFIPSNIEPFCWLPIFLVCAYFIAKRTYRKYFLHGFLVSLVNCVWITVVHLLFTAAYLAHNAKAAALYEKMNKDGLPITKALPLTSLVLGVTSGIFLGFFAVLASKFFSPQPVLHRKQPDPRSELK